MARSFVAADESELIYSGTPAIAATGYTLFGWTHLASSVTGSILSFGLAATNSSDTALARSATAVIFRTVNAVPTPNQLNRNTDHGVSVWTACVAVETAIDDRSVVAEGQTLDEDVVSNDPDHANFNYTSIGMIARVSAVWEMDGDLAWVYGWTVDLNDAENYWLMGGAPPWKVRPNSIAVAMPLSDGADDDYQDGRTYTRNNTVNWSPSPTWMDKFDRKNPVKKALPRGGHSVVMKQVVAV